MFKSYAIVNKNICVGFKCGYGIFSAKPVWASLKAFSPTSGESNPKLCEIGQKVASLALQSDFKIASHLFLYVISIPILQYFAEKSICIGMFCQDYVLSRRYFLGTMFCQHKRNHADNALTTCKKTS